MRHLHTFALYDKPDQSLPQHHKSHTKPPHRNHKPQLQQVDTAAPLHNNAISMFGGAAGYAVMTLPTQHFYNPQQQHEKQNQKAVAFGKQQNNHHNHQVSRRPPAHTKHECICAASAIITN